MKNETSTALVTVDEGYEEMMRLFEELSFGERMRRMIDGLGKPHDSGEYKFAKLQLQRLSAPAIALVMPLALILLMIAMCGNNELPAHEFVTSIVTPDVEDATYEEPPPPPENTPEIADPINVDISIISDSAQAAALDQSQPFSPQPAQMSAVSMIKSPIIFRGIPWGPSPGERGKALRDFDGSAAGEATVMRALRWLKTRQNPDGSWPGQRTAMTALALLTYLAHGETPSSACEEFGPTVEAGLKWLINAQNSSGVFSPMDGNMYAQSIGAYALCEGYSLTRNPQIKDAAERAVSVVVKGQQAGGGFDYKLNPSSARNDLSFTGWAAQAIKAAHIARLEVPGLNEAYAKCVAGVKANAVQGGYHGFGYTLDSQGKDRQGLTGAGVLCLQLLGCPNEDPVVRAGLNYLDGCTFSFSDWRNQPYGGPSPLYYWYYITQAKFKAQGKRWAEWNKAFSAELQKTQIVIKDGIKDAKGNPADIGYWVSPSDNESFADAQGMRGGYVMDTCLCALQLEVYYKFLPTFKQVEVDGEIAALLTKGDVPVDIVF